MTDRPFGADSGIPPAALDQDFAALPVEVIAPGLPFTTHGNTVLPVGVLQPDGKRWKPVARVVLSPDERARLIARLLEHEVLEATRTGASLYETATPAEAIALTGQHHPAPIDVPGPVQALAVEVARLEAHVEELTASRDKMAAQMAADIVRRGELEDWLGKLEASLPPDLDQRLEGLDGKVAALEDRHTALVKSSHGALEDLEAEIDRKLTDHRSTEEDPHEINAALGRVDQRLGDLKDEIAVYDRAIPNDLDARLRRAEADIIDVERSISNLESSVESLELR